MSIMKITKIEPQKKAKGRFSVFINDEFAFGISENDLKRYELSENSVISKNLYDTMIERLVLKRAEFLAYNYLSYTNRTEKEVRNKLKSYGEFEDFVIDNTIDALKRAGVINDEKYAEMFARSKANNRLDGSYKIKRMLAEKGIKSELAYNEMGIDEVSNAVTLIEKKCRNIDVMDWKDKRRIFNYLVRKGYSYSVIKEAFNRMDEEIEVEWD